MHNSKVIQGCVFLALFFSQWFLIFKSIVIFARSLTWLYWRMFGKTLAKQISKQLLLIHCEILKSRERNGFKLLFNQMKVNSSVKINKTHRFWSACSLTIYWLFRIVCLKSVPLVLNGCAIFWKINASCAKINTQKLNWIRSCAKIKGSDHSQKIGYEIWR